ncbi:MAG: hypothetical protein CL468_07420 [Acidimicrobiaceae bacterium]|nr:hypothetical protein [Acidimicrobiaceae bacterium]|tara:strand:+ start:1562 stop:2263 length:702 start_codon:yes stop_codon:yes gene_type:complete
MTKRIAVVSGAAGAIGSAVCDRLTSNGDLVVGLDLIAGTGITTCDVSDENQVESAFSDITQTHGTPEVLVNAAGITGVGGIEEEDPATWSHILDVNLTSAYLCTRQVVGGMRNIGGGKIVNVSSVNGRFGGSALSGPAYAASKGGLITLTRFLAREHAKDNIQVNCVAPGPHDTPMWRALDEGRRTAILATVPSAEAPGDPDQLAGLIQFLCEPDAAYITGATIDINGGQWMG